MQSLISEFRGIVGRRHVHVGARATRRFRRGYRQGDGPVLAVVRPGTPLEQWRVLQCCADAGVVVICQAANTGLTGGSTPDGDGYDRPVVIINTMRMAAIRLIGDGAQVVCLPGATLDGLERKLAPLGREPHSVIGSSCIGATATGGVCNNSGGALVRRGPAYTEMALFARIDAQGRLELVNHLGIDLGTGPEDILRRLEAWDVAPEDVGNGGNAAASDRDYAHHVRDVGAPTPARFNADPRRLHEASGSAGHLAVFALRLDTFAADPEPAVFYIGTNDPDELATLRRDVLSDFEHLPIAGEYLHATAFDLSRTYGKDLFWFIKRFGTRNVPRAFAVKSWIDGVTDAIGLGPRLSDHLLQGLSRLLPRQVPPRLEDWRDRYAHHLLLKTTAEGAAEARACLAGRFPSRSGDVFECDAREAEDAFLLRFAVGGGVVRYRAVHAREVEDIVALDIALPRNTADWFEVLPDEIERDLVAKQYCGHFFCHVLHQEYFVRRGVDCDVVKAKLLATLDTRGARYPAEHNFGHSYKAPEELLQFYRALDPTNSFNPGIGRATKRADWAGDLTV
ncbi:D-lactate dehydrogenase [Pelagovum pacificum]|uniref:Quinone-dependent D-lactate dehydrogenase n=1 Tax=Pelagovum pacificum TaxID=2588711 RepID=A0A5C5GCP5_9RHOB|nr:D-lactate dehydrogenase [Pelagovum pacificum]QQA41438.1 D-lactate dehydrogenase [Pelagovum pacificum]TNY31759.1 D-lactate dehydrogenase [Pelagovum pacificum]